MHVRSRFLLLLAALVAMATGCIDDPAPADAGTATPDEGVEPRDMRVEIRPDAAPPDASPPAPDAAPDARPDGPPELQCRNGLDDDGDGLIDLDDPGCIDAGGDDETDPDPLPVCANGVDEDDDGLVDYPADPDCRSAGWGSEGPVCGAGRAVEALELDVPRELILSRGEAIAGASCGAVGFGPAAVARVTAPDSGILVVDAQPGDEARIFARSSCRDRQTERACRPADDAGPLRVPVDAGDELFVFVQPTAGILPRPINVVARFEQRADDCRNGLDDDGDGRVDQADPGCVDPADPDETDPPVLPECGNGVDDDGDGATDWPDDEDCAAAGGASEGLRGGGECAAGEVIEVGLGVHALGFQLDAADGGLSDGQCGGNGVEGMVRMRIDRPASLDARIISAEIGVVASYLRTDCADPRTETLCDASSAQRVLSVSRLEPGTYYLFVDHDVGFVERVDRVAVDIVLEPLPLRACENGLDDDGDGLVDARDPGCFAASDRAETDPEQAPPCSDGVDGDDDGAVDFPDDRSCEAAGSAAEGSGCPGDGPFIPVGDAGGRFTVDPRPFDPGFAIARCGGDRGAEAVFVLDLNAPADVDVFAEGARAYMRAECAEARTERACDEDGVLELSALEAGRYFVFVEPGDRAVEVDFVVDSLIRDCNDGVDNDEDGLLDLADPGCTGGLDRSELDPAQVPACADGIDNDGDGAIDWPDDPECRAAGDPEEELVCDPAIQVVELGADGGLVDLPEGGQSVTTICGEESANAEVAVAVTVDELSRIRARPVGRVQMRIGARRECVDPETEFACAERLGEVLSVDVEAGTTWLLASAAFGDGSLEVEVEGLIKACNNEVDDDEDGLIDLADPGCTQAFDDDEADPPEVPACADGIDNDDDGAVDWPDDPQCLAAGTPDEAVACPPLDDVVVVPPEGGLFETDTAGRDNFFEAPCAGQARGGEQVLAFVLDAPTRVDVEVLQADYDTALFVRGSCIEGDVIACDDDGGDGLLSRIDQVFEAGIWYIFVDGFAQNAGAAQVRVQFE